jgi:hypothetical protein
MAKGVTKSGQLQAKSAKSAYAGKSLPWKKDVEGKLTVENVTILTPEASINIEKLQAGVVRAVRLGRVKLFSKQQYLIEEIDAIAVKASKVKPKISIVLNTQHSTCIIIEVTDSKVIAEVLIDKDKQLNQTRSFDKLPLEGVVDCKEGTIFNLTIVTKPGSREFIYTPGNPDDIKYFEETLVDTTSLRNDLKNDPVYNQGPILNDDGDSF